METALGTTHVHVHTCSLYMHLVHVHLYAQHSVNRLTWHSSVIPPNEVWVKLGGDKGGESFKMSLQIVNTPHPNSIQNTCVFVVFETSDSVTNLKVVLGRYKEQVSMLQTQCWR